MKKIIVLIISLCLFSSPSFGYYYDRNNHKLLYGLILGGVGMALALHGFTMAKDDISEPSIDSSHYASSYNFVATTWYGRTDGQVTNTGNVNLKGYTVNVNYYDEYDNCVGSRFQFYDALNMGETVSWSTEPEVSCGTFQPVRAEVYTSELDYDHIYRTRQNNQTEGVVGVVVFGVGAYLMIDYALNVNKFDEYLQKYDMDVKFAASRQSVGFMVSKKM